MFKLMKTFNEFINESQEQSKLDKKIIKLLDGDIIQAIIKRQQNWDENKFKFSREPMFLIADLDSNPNDQEHIRNLDWIHKKFARGYRKQITGTMANYDILNDDGDKPCSVLGIFLDRQFYPIVSLDTFDKILNLLFEEE